MSDMQEIAATRKQICVRLLFTLLFLIIFEVLKLVIQITVVFQFIYLLITRKYSDPLRNFSNKVATYAYKIIRYMTLNGNYRPFPFNDFPAVMEKAEGQASFDGSI